MPLLDTRHSVIGKQDILLPFQPIIRPICLQAPPSGWGHFDVFASSLDWFNASFVSCGL